MTNAEPRPSVSDARRELLRAFEALPIREWSASLLVSVQAVIDAHRGGTGVALQEVENLGVRHLRVVE
jgi:hypothetical protein